MSDVAAAGQAAHSSQPRHLPVAFWALLVLTAAVRLPAINRPLVGNFATKNVVYAMIARNWADGSAGIWYPTLDCLSDGRPSWHLVEFPVSAYLTAGLWKGFGGSLDVWGRSTAVAFSTASVAVMFLFVRRRHGQGAATAAGLALALSPVSIIYGQSFMLEASLVFFTMATFCSMQRWLDAGSSGWLAVAAGCLALLLLTKVYMLVVLLPLAVMAVRSDRVQTRSARQVLVVALALAVGPAVLWYVHAYRTASPDGPFAERIFYSVRESAEAHRPPHPLLGSPDFYRQVLDDLTGVVLTPVGFVLSLAGLLDRRWRQHAAWLLAMLVLVLALPRKFHEMNYYYLAVLPPLCVMAGIGWQVIQRRVRPGPSAVALLLLVSILLSLRYSVRPAFATPHEDRGVLAAARAVRALTSQDEPVVTMHGTTIDLLYYCRRGGWAVGPDTPQLDTVLDGCRRQGARYLAVVGPGPAPSKPAAQGDNFRIYRLSPAANAATP